MLSEGGAYSNKYDKWQHHHNEADSHDTTINDVLPEPSMKFTRGLRLLRVYYI